MSISGLEKVRCRILTENILIIMTEEQFIIAITLEIF